MVDSMVDIEGSPCRVHELFKVEHIGFGARVSNGEANFHNDLRGWIPFFPIFKATQIGLIHMGVLANPIARYTCLVEEFVERFGEVIFV